MKMNIKGKTVPLRSVVVYLLYVLVINLTKSENTRDSFINFKSPCLMKTVPLQSVVVYLLYALEINLSKSENTRDSFNNFKSHCLMKMNIEGKLFHCHRLWSNSSLVNDYILEINLTKCEHAGNSYDNF